jgi:glycosyltransferase involved in cell wall biosynthesis
MRILYVSRETPLQPAGGIATYLDYMARAMRAAGHEVFLFSWTETPGLHAVDRANPFKAENTHVEVINAQEVYRTLSVVGENLYLGTYLSERIAQKMREWDIDVVEATDFLAPCLHLFQAMQTDAGADRRLCVTYNHGFIDDFFEADQMQSSHLNRIDNLCERQQCRISDLVVAPSQAARGRLAGYGMTERVEVIREPFRFTNTAAFAGPQNAINYLGRISVSKGIDKLIYAANALHDVFPLREIKLVGRVIATPFRNDDMRSYVLARLRPELRFVTTFTDFLPREMALNIISNGTIAPSLGSAETFSYACVESLDANLLPIVRQGTPMAEFFPDHLQEYVLDAEMRSVKGLQATMLRLIDNAGMIMREVREFCEADLAPEKVAEDMGRAYDRALGTKRGRRVVAGAVRPMTLADVTILIPAYKPTREFLETVDSLSAQTAGMPPDFQQWFDYAEAQLPDCRILRQPNCGLLAARNTLIEGCETELALFLDTDDLLAPEALQHLLDAWNGALQPPDAIIPQRRNFAESNEPVLRHFLDDHLHVLENDYRMTALIRTSALRRIGFDSTRRNGEGDDWTFWLKFSGLGFKGLMLPYQEFLYRFRKGSMSWPWSEGQQVGTQTMVREAMLEVAQTHPQAIHALTRALFTRNVGS